MIKPEVGRVILFWPGPQTPGICHNLHQPFSGRIAYPWNDRMINVEYIDHNGSNYRLTSVILLQDNDPKPDGQPFATWMPYQTGQAAKYEAGGGKFEELTKRVADLEHACVAIVDPHAQERLRATVADLEQIKDRAPKRTNATFDAPVGEA